MRSNAYAAAVAFALVALESGREIGGGVATEERAARRRLRLVSSDVGMRMHLAIADRPVSE